MPDIFVDEKDNVVETAKTANKKTGKKTVNSTAASEQALPVSEPSVSAKEEPARHATFWQRVQQPLKAYVVNPPQMHFESQEAEEKVILLLRRHPITNVPWIVSGIIMLLAPVVLFPLFSFLNPFPTLPLSYHFIFTLFWYVMTFGVILVKYLSWFFNVYLVTTERIVDVDFHNLVHREISSTRISKIQDVTYKVSGVIRSIFDYGDVFIQTAGTEENFIFEATPQPQNVVKTISELIEKHEEEQKPKGGV